jgi:hypothetical protein
MGMIETFKSALGVSKTRPDVKLGRNDTCWCGSGKKYKHCHLEVDANKRSAIMDRNLCKTPT